MQYSGNVLQVSGVQISDDFFEIGGDSLRATEFVAKVEKIFKVKIGFEIFENSKISMLQKPLKIREMR